MSGFSFQNLRLAPPAEEPGADGPIDVAMPALEDDSVKVNPKTKVVEVKLPDGSVNVYLGGVDGDPADDSLEDPKKFGKNLADKIDPMELGRIAEEIMTGIGADEESRKEWVESGADAMNRLGLNMESATKGSSSDGAAPLEGMSRYRATLMLEATIRFQARARAELLPTDGPVKVRNDDPNATITQDSDANCLQRDMNHYLTVVDTAYYPDTARALWWTGYQGCAFKKVYHHPLKRRPVSETVAANDLIVSSTAPDIYSASRVTQRIRMRKSMMRRMQIVKAYRKVNLGEPEFPAADAIQEQKEAITGVRQTQAIDPKDRDYELFECYCELDIAGFEHKDADGEPDGLPLPYKVTIEKTSREILEVRRNWKQEDELCMPINRFVKYSHLDIIGFYAIGYAQTLGPTNNAISALARETIDAGMFANFPGGLVAKGVVKQNQSTFRAAPGEFLPIDIGASANIRDAVMAYPYKEPSPGSFQIMEMLGQSGARLGNVAELQVGEGRQDAPVGTTIAMLEAAEKPMDEVHKGLHASQAMEIQLLLDRIREDPQSFIRSLRRPAKQWNNEALLRAINDYDLVPVSDPNTSSRMQRIGKAQALYQMAKENFQAFDQKAVYEYVFDAMGLGSPDSFLQSSGGPAPDPKVQAEGAKAEAALLSAKADVTDSQTKAEEARLKAANMQLENNNRDLDRSANLHIADAKLTQTAVVHHAEQAAKTMMHDQQLTSDQIMHAADLQSDQENAPPANPGA